MTPTMVLPNELRAVLLCFECLIFSLSLVMVEASDCLAVPLLLLLVF
jgi:hypothetical protein